MKAAPQIAHRASPPSPAYRREPQPLSAAAAAACSAAAADMPANIRKRPSNRSLSQHRHAVLKSLAHVARRSLAGWVSTGRATCEAIVE